MNADLPLLHPMEHQAITHGKERPGYLRERPALHLFTAASNMQSTQASSTGNHNSARSVAAEIVERSAKYWELKK